MNHQFHCHGGGHKFSHSHGASLHCSAECEAQHAVGRKMIEEALGKAGFSQMKDVPNLWEKDGMHLSIEKVIREGLDQALAQLGS